MQFKYILYLLFLTLFACEHHSKNINIKNKPEDKKIIVNKENIIESSVKNEKEKILQNLKNSERGRANVQRFKGLGEMNPSQLRDTTLAPGKRRLLKLESIVFVSPKT